MMTSKLQPEVALLLEIYDQAYQGRSWHGTNLRGSVRGVTAEAACWRPQEGRHNIREIVLHAAYWKYAAWRRLKGEKRGSFPLKGSNWISRPKIATDKEWREDVALLERFHRQLRDAIAPMTDNQLRKYPKGSRVTRATLIYGIASHDLYHTGQIQLLKRLRK